MMYQQKPNHNIRNTESVLLNLSKNLEGLIITGQDFDKVRILNILYGLIDTADVVHARTLTKRENSTFVHAATAIARRAGIVLNKLEVQTLFGLDPVSKSYSNKDLPNRTEQKNVFSYLAAPITRQDIEEMGIGFDPANMSLIINGNLIEGVSKPLNGKVYSVFQILRDPFDSERVHLRGNNPTIHSEKIVRTTSEGIYFKSNSKEALMYADKALIFILES